MRKKFSLAVEGSGQLVNPFFSTACERWPRAEVFDRTDQTNLLRGQEAGLGFAGLLDAAGRRSANRTARNLRSPPRTDVVIGFTPLGAELKVKIVGKSARQGNFSFPAKIASEAQLNGELDQLIIGVENLI